MPWEFLGLVQLPSLFVMEATTTGSQNHSRKERGGSPGHVHYAPAGKVHHSHPKQRIFLIGAQESIRTPDGMCHYWIDESRQEQRIAEVRRHLATFGQGARHNGGGRRAKGVLEHPKGKVFHTHQTKVGGSNKSIRIVAIAKCKGVSKRIKGNRCSAL
jgi:hypothetical protein